MPRCIQHVATGLLLALDLGETKAIETLRLVVVDRGSPLDMRTRALNALVERPPQA